MKELFRKCFKQCVKEGNPLRILLESDSSEVHQIRWEVKYFEEERLFMGNSSYFTFSRSIFDSLAIDLDIVKRPMKLLVLVSNSLNLPDEDYEIDIREIERSFLSQGFLEKEDKNPPFLRISLVIRITALFRMIPFFEQ